MNTGALLIGIVVFALITGAVGYEVGNAKGRGLAGFWLGFFFSVIGIVIVAVMTPSPEAQAQRDQAQARALAAAVAAKRTSGPSRQRRPCPQCAEMILLDAVVCRYCGAQITPAGPSPSVVKPPFQPAGEEVVVCMGCARSRRASEQSCPKCGRGLDAVYRGHG